MNKNDKMIRKVSNGLARIAQTLQEGLELISNNPELYKVTLGALEGPDVENAETFSIPQYIAEMEEIEDKEKKIEEQEEQLEEQEEELEELERELLQDLKEKVASYAPFECMDCFDTFNVKKGSSCDCPSCGSLMFPIF